MTAMLAGIAALGVVWSPLRLALPLLVAAILPPIAQACLGGARARFPDAPRGMARLARRALTAALHLIQPIARLRGRILEGDRKSTRLNSSHGYISYAVFCLKKKKNMKQYTNTQEQSRL